MACTCAFTSLIGCQIYARGTTGTPKKTVRHGEPVTLRKDQLPGAGELLPDGRVRYVVALPELCQAPKLIDEQFVMAPAVTPGGLGLFIGSTALMVGGGGLVAHSVISEQELGADNSGRKIEAAVGVSALIVGAVMLGLVAQGPQGEAPVAGRGGHVTRDVSSGRHRGRARRPSSARSS